MRCRKCPERGCRGLTLVELLVVIVVLMLLLAMAAQGMRSSVEQRRVREAARVLRGYIARAQGTAAERGRPVGLLLERDDVTTPEGTVSVSRIFMAEVEAPYTGDTTTERARVIFPNIQNGPVFPNNQLTRGLIQFRNDPLQQWGTGAGMLPTLVNREEAFFIRFDNRGPLYVAQRLNTNTPEYEIKFHAGATPHPIAPDGARFEIFRRPSRSSSQPLEMPRGTIIDLSISGLGGAGMEFNPFRAGLNAQQRALERKRPLVIMFDPGGGLQQVTIGDTQVVPVSPLHMLVGRAEQALPNNLAVQSEQLQANLVDMRNFWVTISPRDGAVSVSDNANSAPPPNSTNNTLAQRIFRARAMARTGFGAGEG